MSPSSSYTSTLNIGTGLSDLGDGTGPVVKRIRVLASQYIFSGKDISFSYIPHPPGIGQPIGLLLSLTKSS